MCLAIKIVLAICVVVLPLRAATNAAASLDVADVQAAVDASTHGDTVILPAGSNAWTSRLLVTNQINVIGQGTNDTIIVDEIASRDFVMRFYFTNWTTGVTNVISGIQFKGGSLAVGGDGYLMVVGSPWRTNGAYSNWRISTCFWNHPKGRPAAIYCFGNGLLDSNYFNLSSSGFRIDGRTPNSGQKGDSPWAENISRGQVNAWLYFEGNTFTSTNTPRAITDAFAGARYVFRYNTVTNFCVENHGTDSTGRYRSGRDMEVYQNVFHATSSGEYAVHSRGGSGVVFSNAVTGSFPGLWRGLNYRTIQNLTVPWSSANGTNKWDLNDETEYATGTHTGTNGARLLQDSNAVLVAQAFSNVAHVINLTRAGTTNAAAGHISSNGATWIATYNDINNSLGGSVYWDNGDFYTVRKVIRALDGSGNGTGDLLTGSSDTTNPTPHAWPNQANDPWHFWANTGITNLSSGLDYTLVAGRDYTNAVKSGYSPLAYPHPLAGGSTPTPRTARATTARVKNLRVNP